MAKIEWDESFSVNDREIDEQHKKWIAIYNNFHENLLKGDVQVIRSLGGETLQSMQDYANYHFTFEEEYMRKHNYPQIVEHKRLHKDFDTLIYKYNKECREGSYVLGSEIAKILRNWIINHILNEDKRYSLYISKLPD